MVVLGVGQVISCFVDVFICVVNVVLSDVELFTLVTDQSCDLLLDLQHVLHLVLYVQQLLCLCFNQLSLE